MTSTTTSRTPVLLLLDTLLSQDDPGITTVLSTMRHELPANVVFQHGLLYASSSYNNNNNNNNIVSHLSAYLQTFPHQATIASDHDGSLPLHFAASLGDVTIAQIVWQAFPTGALIPNHKGKLPLHYAAREGKTAVVHFLLHVAPQTAAMASGKDKLALHFAAGEGHLPVVQALLRVYPAAASLPSAKGKLPLHFCSRWGHLHVARELLRYYPQASRGLDWEGSTCLHEACREGQADMARFLMDQLPEALATANLRNEIPLFPAVRVNTSLELVLDLLQAWPGGAKHVLQHVTADDRIATWNPAVVEALLRATVECWQGFAPWQQNRAPPFLRLHAAQVNHVLPAYEEEEEEEEQDTTNDSNNSNNNNNITQEEKKMKKLQKKKEKKEKKDKKDKLKKDKETPQLGTIEDRRPRLWTAGPFTSIRVERIPPAESAAAAQLANKSARSKSPILDQSDETTVRPRKRVRSSYRSQRNAMDSDTDDTTNLDDGGTPAHRPASQVFCALQAALGAQASLPVLKHTLQLFPESRRNLVDGESRTLLHLALQNAKLARDNTRNGGADWILEHVYRAEWSTHRDAASNALPLHIALHSRACCRLVQALLRDNPSSAVDSCETRDEWYDEKPLTLACQSDCDYSTVYLLLRADPSIVPGLHGSR